MNESSSANSSKKMRVTLSDVAREADVSPATASQVLNNRPNCWASTETRQRIIETAKRLGYRPNLAARSLRAGMSRSIAKISPAFYLGTHHNQATGVFESARNAHYVVLFSVHGNVSEHETSLIQLHWDRGVDGMIVTPCEQGDHKELQRLVNIGYPIVTMDGAGRLPFPCNDVSADYAAAGRLQAEHLLTMGRKRIAICNSLFPHFSHALRQEAIRRTLEQGGAPPPLVLDLNVAPDCELPDHQSLEAELRRVLTERKGQFDALIGCDYTCSVAIRILAELGLQVPADVAVVGTGNLPIALYGVVPLTSVSLDDEWIGREAFQMLVDRIEKRTEGPPAQRLSVPKLIPRRSSVSA